MGTNYYVETEDVGLMGVAGYLNRLGASGQDVTRNNFHRAADIIKEAAVKQLHIGKSSWGWCFSLHVIPELGLNSLDDWQTFLQKPENKYKIKDENGQAVEYHRLLMLIINRKAQRDNQRNEFFEMERNHAVPGPNGLWRHKRDGHHCIAHGEGTWDLIASEFS